MYVSETAPTYFKELNEDQIAAVSHYLGPALVVAGPGSGKTRVLTHRVAYLIKEKNVSETGILCVTFTNKAANEIKIRVKKLLSSESVLPWSGTFHSICAKILRKDGRDIGIPISFVIYDTDDQAAVIKSIEKDFGIDTKRFHSHAVLEHISGAKSEMVTPQMYEGYAQGYFQKTVAKIFPEYQKRLRQNNALDFDDLLLETVRLFEESPHILEKYQNVFQFILVDEYQDTNKVQYVLTKMLAGAHENLFVVGDMSQAIYSFRGADFRNILNFQNDYPKATIYHLGKKTRVFAEKDPAALPWGELGVDAVLECTGKFTENDSAKAHITAGAKKVVISAPTKGGDTQTFLIGVNESQYLGQNVISNASCTTNCISPVIAVVHSQFKVLKAIMSTVHAVTANQSVVDGPPSPTKPDLRRSRAAGWNIVPTSTGAAKATTLVIPDLAGKFDGISLRVPIITGSISDITMVVEKRTTVEEVNKTFLDAKNDPKYRGVIDATYTPLVSSDIIKSPYSAIVDLAMTRVVDGDLVKVLAWYDNEWGYSCRLVEMAVLVSC